MNDQEKINLIIGLTIFLAIYMVWVGCNCNGSEGFFGGGSGSCPPAPTCPACPSTPTCPAVTDPRQAKIYVSDYLDSSYPVVANFFSSLNSAPPKEVIDAVKTALINGLRISKTSLDKLTDDAVFKLYMYCVYSANFIDTFVMGFENANTPQGHTPRTMTQIITAFSTTDKLDIATNSTTIPTKFSTGSHETLFIPQAIMSAFTDTELFYISNSILIKNGIFTPTAVYENGVVKRAGGF